MFELQTLMPFAVREERIDVIAYSGGRGEESPRSFVLRNERIDVVDIIDTWVQEELDRSRKRFFKIKGSDGHVHRICYAEKTMTWFVQL